MSAATPPTAASPVPAGRARPELARLVVWIVAGVLFAYVLWQAIGNLVGVTTTLNANNAFLRANGGEALQTSVPWVALVIDLLLAPVGWTVAFLVSRRATLGRTVVVFFAALCAVAVGWFDVLEYVSTTLRVGG